ncbi:MAG TPA: SRPBCC domain-containing protein [Chondromyces sp.]|jgi:uncharacterized protein YndB with AHSA1/START domain|nr:SRPBCC domain-containing protein [Chondromyces sp.]
MTTIELSTRINAPKERVWNMLWSDAGYRKWTSVFCEGSYAESDWQEGSKIRFLTPTGEGMYGIIQKNVPFEQMIFEHKGEIKNGLEKSKEWAGVKERYHLIEKDGVTELNIVMDATEEFREYFSTTFPKALEVVKQISEQ